MATSEELITKFSQHTAYLQRLGATEGNKVTPYLNAIEADIASILKHYENMNITPARQQKIIDEINATSRRNLQLYTKGLAVENRALGAYEAEFTQETIDSAVIGDDFQTIAPSASQVNTVAIATPIKLSENQFSSYSHLMTNYWQKWTAEIDGAVQNGFVSGQSTREIANSILDTIGQTKTGTGSGTLDKARRSAKQLAITGTNHYANTARVAYYKGNEDVIKGFRSIAVLDSRTSRQCSALDGVVMKVTDKRFSRFVPPRHPNCRSAITPEVDDKYKLDDDTSKRASSFEVDGKRDGKQVSSKQTYYDAMDKLKASDQDDILGPTLGKAFRKLDNPDAFAQATIDNFGNPLTIEEMKKGDTQLAEILRAG